MLPIIATAYRSALSALSALSLDFPPSRICQLSPSVGPTDLETFLHHFKQTEEQKNDFHQEAPVDPVDIHVASLVSAVVRIRAIDANSEISTFVLWSVQTGADVGRRGIWQSQIGHVSATAGTRFQIVQKTDWILFTLFVVCHQVYSKVDSEWITETIGEIGTGNSDSATGTASLHCFPVFRAGIREIRRAGDGIRAEWGTV